MAGDGMTFVDGGDDFPLEPREEFIGPIQSESIAAVQEAIRGDHDDAWINWIPSPEEMGIVRGLPGWEGAIVAQVVHGTTFRIFRTKEALHYGMMTQGDMRVLDWY